MAGSTKPRRCLLSFGRRTLGDTTIIITPPDWTVVRVRYFAFEVMKVFETFDHPTKDNVLAIQMGSRAHGNEKLAAVGVRSRVRHTQQSTLVVR